MSTEIVVFVCVTQAIVVVSAVTALLSRRRAQHPSAKTIKGEAGSVTVDGGTVTNEQRHELELISGRTGKKKKGKGLKTAMKLALKTAKNLMNQDPVEFTSNSQLDAFNILMFDEKASKYMLYVADKDTALEIVDMVEDASIDFITGS